MAKNVTKAVARDDLTMSLFAPGMSALHRAGLGGLACTLKAMERQYENGSLAKSKLPGPLQDDRPPWEIDEHAVTLRFGKSGRDRNLYAAIVRLRIRNSQRRADPIARPTQHRTRRAVARGPSVGLSIDLSATWQGPPVGQGNNDGEL